MSALLSSNSDSDLQIVSLSQPQQRMCAAGAKRRAVLHLSNTDSESESESESEKSESKDKNENKNENINDIENETEKESEIKGETSETTSGSDSESESASESALERVLERLPWPRIFAYLHFADVARVGRVSRRLRSASAALRRLDVHAGVPSTAALAALRCALRRCPQLVRTHV